MATCADLDVRLDKEIEDAEHEFLDESVEDEEHAQQGIMN